MPGVFCLFPFSGLTRGFPRMFTRRHGPALGGKSHGIVGTPSDLVPRAFLTHSCAHGASAICCYESGLPTQRCCWGHFQLRGLCSRLGASPCLLLRLPSLGGSPLPCVSPSLTDSQRVVHFASVQLLTSQGRVATAKHLPCGTRNQRSCVSVSSWLTFLC